MDTYDRLVKKVENAMIKRYGKVAPAKLKTVTHQLQFLKNIMVEVDTLSKGICFGEFALLDPKGKRSASVKCITDCYFGFIHKHVYDSIISKLQKQAIDQKTNMLKQCPQFSKFRRGILTRYHYLFKPKVYYKGQVIYK